MIDLKIKICGITNVDDAELALTLGADYLGFILYPPSPRYIHPDAVTNIIRELQGRGFSPKGIGVFVNEEPETVNKIVEKTSLWGVQLHGEESPEYCATMNAEAVIKAFRIGQNPIPRRTLEHYDVFAFLFDAFQKGQYGGTGMQFDHSLIREITPYYKVFVAGGITPENALKAVRICDPYGLDISSGVELKPGVKDPEKLERLFMNLREKLSE